MAKDFDLNESGSLRNTYSSLHIQALNREKSLRDLFGEEKLIKLLKGIKGQEVISIHSEPQSPVNYLNLEGLYFSKGVFKDAGPLGIYGVYFRTTKTCSNLGQLYDVVSVSALEADYSRLNSHSGLSAFNFRSENGPIEIRDIVLAKDALGAFGLINGIRDKYHLTNVTSSPGLVFRQETDHSRL